MRRGCALAFPALLAAGLSGCPGSPPVSATPPPVVKSFSGRDYLARVAKAKTDLAALVAEAQAATFEDAADVKSKRNHYFSMVRASCDDPVLRKYDALSTASRVEMDPSRRAHERAVRSAEEALRILFDAAYLHFKPWQKPRFARQRSRL